MTPRRSVWRWPLLLGIASIVGLLSALLGDGAWDAVSWVGLGMPVAVCLWFGIGRRAGEPMDRRSE